mmetsp:Transcript_9216/g.12763  ORF Transcript_9216/g.12763 Transcript_9216/m.12763 type:complete len:214 (+) Transcript_9216:63-704(+)|eukprot:CAMPEP_0197296550 /NCGR_PEP_ID=MMETSP0890-20130614/38670_1 /TAXON_ID=44058 ORGANISM="Aureoumbra lagunensis, Strain CCMP1510" /NCGR_SAMPLE_ID=MMETSP0890 /ASSEMBLY_ACC=CAM_ASM_000533 /LENGTH=213 /DNA_ID=CAMNT_0042773163 /DNA_START=67 /DNA_END=708 /DNA_ORIENTATION=+
MIITVLGATGGTGRHFVKRALKEGQSLRLIVRSPAKLPEEVKNSKNVEIFEGSFTDLDLVDRAIKGSDAVVSMARGGGKITMESLITSVVGSMRKHGVKKIFYQAGALSAQADSWPAPSMMLARYVLLPLFKGVYGLGADNEKVIAFLDKCDDLDWIITRPGLIVDEESKGKLVQSTYSWASKTSYCDIRSASYDNLTDPKAIKTCDYLDYEK